MQRSAIFGVIGGSGCTGKAVAEELRRSPTDRAILIGGRDLAKLHAVAAELGAAVSAIKLDVRDPRSLEEFCGRCSVVVNCGGPVSELQDMVAQAALRTQSHYDPRADCTSSTWSSATCRVVWLGEAIIKPQNNDHAQTQSKLSQGPERECA